MAAFRFFFSYAFSPFSLTSQPISLVLHDWGCMYGYMVQRAHPELVKNVVACDIGTHAQPDIVGWVLLILYQWYLILAWTVGLIAPKGGDAMARAFAKLIKAPRAVRYIFVTGCRTCMMCFFDFGYLSVRLYL